MLRPISGLKAQHVASIEWLAKATKAKVTGLVVGSKTIDFMPLLSPKDLDDRNIKVQAQSAASLLLVFQAILPFLLFAGDADDSPLTVTIQGGTNVSWSLSFEYLDQVLLPALERFDIKIERHLEFRGWSHGTPQVGSAKFKLVPFAPGRTIKSPNWPLERGTITKIDVSIIVPSDMQSPLRKYLLTEIGRVFPGVEANIFLVEDSKHRARLYTLLVAHTTTGLRFGRDWLYDKTTKNKSVEDLSTEIARKTVNELDKELQRGGVVDEYLQDQLVVFQALAEGKSSIPFSSEAISSGRDRVDRTDEPFGDGSMHTMTARWVTSQLLPQSKWIDKGRICEGIGWKVTIMPPAS